DSADDIFRHGGVDFSSEFDEARCLAVFACFPGQIKRVDGNTVAAQTWARIKRHESKRFRLGGVDDLPDVYAHRAVNDFQFIHQGDIDAAENVLEELAGFGGAAGGNRHDGFD